MKIKIVNKSRHRLPVHQTQHSAAVDLTANIDAPVKLEPLERVLIPTGLYMALPPGFEAQVRPRSGLAIKHGVTLVNSPGTIDADYRGEIGIILINLSKEPYTVEDGERIAQLLVSKYEPIQWEEVSKLDETSRKGGFGSTGK